MQARFEAVTKNEDNDALLSLAPKTPNWDLKRDIEPNMEYLDHQTQASLLQLLKANIKAKEIQK